MARFERFAPEPKAIIPDGATIEVQLKTAREIERERLDFKRDRFGHNNPSGMKPCYSRITYMASASGYVMARRPGCMPFVISEKLWRSFAFWEKDNPVHR